jgi:hypothetical protein
MVEERIRRCAPLCSLILSQPPVPLYRNQPPCQVPSHHHKYCITVGIYLIYIWILNIDRCPQAMCKDTKVQGLAPPSPAFGGKLGDDSQFPPT